MAFRSATLSSAQNARDSPQSNHSCGKLSNAIQVEVPIATTDVVARSALAPPLKGGTEGRYHAIKHATDETTL